MLVSAAADGEPARGLASFGALALLLDPGLAVHAEAGMPEASPLTPEGRERLARSLAELRDAARELANLRLWACAAAVETMGLSPEALDGRLDGVMSTPRFLREVATARLLFV